MRGASFLVIPSICYENFPLVVVEAYALGLPVMASDLGGLAALVPHGITGLRVQPGDAEALARMIAWAHAHPTELQAMGIQARREFEEKYTPEQNHRLLLAVYEDAIAHAHGRN
jgi:glycosyltransferase involved in cell wall biosynthesis